MQGNAELGRKKMVEVANREELREAVNQVVTNKREELVAHGFNPEGAADFLFDICEDFLPSVETLHEPPQAGEDKVRHF